MRSIEEVKSSLGALRSRLEVAYSDETKYPLSTSASSITSGQCAVTVLLLHDLYGGEILSTVVEGESHWFNRINFGFAVCDVDITGDQYGFPEIQVKRVGSLYPNSRLRSREEVHLETERRLELLKAALNTRRLVSPRKTED